MSIFHYLTRRLVYALPTLIGLTFVTFLLANYLPGDPLVRVLGERGASDPEIVAAYREEWGLDQSLPVRYVTYMGNLLTGDLGRSTTTQRPVREDLGEFFPATVELAIGAMVVSSVLGLAFGIIAALNRNRWPDFVVRFVAVLASGIPVFWLALVALQIFYLRLGWTPGPEGRLSSNMEAPPHTTGLYTVDALLHGQWGTFQDAATHLLLPSVVLGMFFLGLIARMTRASLLDVLRSGYLTTARAKGLKKREILFVHALPNALIPVITVLGLAVGGLLAGAVLTETIFAWPGVGRYAVDASKNLDYQAILGVTIVTGLIYVLANVAVDVLYAILDPRIRLEQ